MSDLGGFDKEGKETPRKRWTIRLREPPSYDELYPKFVSIIYFGLTPPSATPEASLVLSRDPESGGASTGDSGRVAPRRLYSGIDLQTRVLGLCLLAPMVQKQY